MSSSSPEIISDGSDSAAPAPAKRQRLKLEGDCIVVTVASTVEHRPSQFALASGSPQVEHGADIFFGLAITMQWKFLECSDCEWHEQMQTRRYSEKLGGVKSLSKIFDIAELEFETEDGQQTAILCRPVAGETERLYLVFGGNAMVARDWLSIFSDINWRSKGATSFVLVDYPGFGSSDGKPSINSIVAVARGALDEALSTLDPSPTFVGAIGHSIGCAVALALAAEETEPRLHHLVLSAPFTSIAEMAGQLLPLLKAVPGFLIEALTSRHAWNNRDMARKLAGPAAPKIDLLHGRQDEICPFRMGEEMLKLFEELKYNVSFTSYDYGHNDVLGSPDYLKWLHRRVWET